MVPRKSGLIVNVSSPGGLVYLFNVAYGVGKAACDRMAADCGTELKKHNVTMISLWPGAVETEMIKTHVLGRLSLQKGLYPDSLSPDGISPGSICIDALNYRPISI